MDLIAQRGIAAHYSGREFVTGLVGSALPSCKSSRGKTVSLTNANIALRVCYLSLIDYDRKNVLKGTLSIPITILLNFNAITLLVLALHQKLRS